jgi:hypothetical protein
VGTARGGAGSFPLPHFQIGAKHQPFHSGEAERLPSIRSTLNCIIDCINCINGARHQLIGTVSLISREGYGPIADIAVDYRFAKGILLCPRYDFSWLELISSLYQFLFYKLDKFFLPIHHLPSISNGRGR